MTGLARLLEIAFRDDIRNGMAHADYILGPDGLRLPRRNGGQPVVVSHQQMQDALQIALFFFELLQAFQQATAQTFRPARTVIGRFSENPPMPWTIELAEDGTRTKSPCAYWSALTQRVKASTFRPGATIWSISTCRGTPPGWNNATAASTASCNRRPRFSAATSSMSSVPRT
jgi:hypothetical protein